MKANQVVIDALKGAARVSAHVHQTSNGWWVAEVRFETPPTSRVWKKIKSARSREGVLQNVKDYVGERNSIIMVTDF